MVEKSGYSMKNGFRMMIDMNTNPPIDLGHSVIDSIWEHFDEYAEYAIETLTWRYVISSVEIHIQCLIINSVYEAVLKVDISNFIKEILEKEL